MARFLWRNFYGEIFIAKFLWQNFYRKIFMAKLLWRNFYRKIFITKFLSRNFHRKIDLKNFAKFFFSSLNSTYGVRLCNITISHLNKTMKSSNKWSITNRREFTTDHLLDVFVVFRFIQISKMLKHFIVCFIFTLVIFDIVRI